MTGSEVGLKEPRLLRRNFDLLYSLLGSSGIKRLLQQTRDLTKGQSAYWLDGYSVRATLLNARHAVVVDVLVVEDGVTLFRGKLGLDPHLFRGLSKRITK
ncbi:MAG: hypothetical protein ACE5KU_01405 [Nitrososphaerales archaeon]